MITWRGIHETVSSMLFLEVVALEKRKYPHYCPNIFGTIQPNVSRRFALGDLQTWPGGNPVETRRRLPSRLCFKDAKYTRSMV